MTQADVPMPRSHNSLPPAPVLMPSALRNPLTLFLLVLFGQLGILLGSLGMGGLTPTHLLLAMGISASIALLWDFAFHRPIRQGMTRVEHRIGRLSAVPRKVADPVLSTGDDHSRRLEYRLVARQDRIARYARQLRRELARFRSIYSHSHDAVMIFEPGDGRLVDSNPRAAEFLGVEPDQLKGARLFELHDEDEPQLRALIDDVMDSRQGRSVTHQLPGRRWPPDSGRGFGIPDRARYRRLAAVHCA